MLITYLRGSLSIYAIPIPSKGHLESSFKSFDILLRAIILFDIILYDYTLLKGLIYDFGALLK